MPSLNELKRSNQQKQDENNNEKKREQETIDLKYKKKKEAVSKIEDYKKGIDLSTDLLIKEEIAKKNKVTQAFKAAVLELKDQFEYVKNEPNSIFSPFFKKDENGNPINKIDFSTVLNEENGIDEILENKNEIKKHSRSKKDLQAKKVKIEKSLSKNKKNLEGFYKDTTEHKNEIKLKKEEEEKEEKEKEEKYLSDKYVKKGNYVNDLICDIKNKKGYYNNNDFPTPYNYESLDSLIVKENDKVDDVKELINKKIEEGIKWEEGVLELDKTKKGLDSVSNFQKERISVFNSLRDLENEAIDFTDKIYNIEGVSSYFGSKDNMSKDFLNREFSINFSIIKKFLSNYSEDEKKILDLDLIKKCIDDQKIYMSKFLELKETNPEKITEYFKSNEKPKLYKEIVGVEKPGSSSDGNFYPQEVYFGKSFNSISLTAINDFYNKESKFFNEKQTIIEKYADSAFNVAIKIKKIRIDYKDDPQSLKSTLERIKEKENSLNSYLKWNIDETETMFKEKLDEKLVGFPHDIFFEKDSDKLNELKTEIEGFKKEVKEKEDEIKKLKDKKLGIFESKSKHEIVIKEVEDKLSELKSSLEYKKTNLNYEKTTIERSDNSQIIKKLFVGDSRVYKDLLLKELYNIDIPITLREACDKMRKVINNELLKTKNKKEENNKIEEDLKEYFTLDEIKKKSKEELISFYKEKIENKK